MNKLAIIFPGQGVQYTGLFNQYLKTTSLKSIKENKEYISNSIATIINDYDTVVKAKLGINISDLLTTYENESDSDIKAKSLILNRTTFTQIAIQLFSHLRFEQFKKTNSLSQYSNLFVYGRSLGETSSILLTSNLSNKEMCDIVMMRGLITEEESKLNDGKMMNIIGDSNKIIEILNEYIKSNNVSDFTIAGIHSKRLVVLSGNKDSLNKVALFLKDIIKVTIKDLNVQGAFHSNLMNNAQLRFHDYLNDKNHNFAISCSTYKRLTTVSKYRSLDINNNSNHIRTLMSNTLIEPYDTNTLFTILRDESIETFDLSMNSYLKYNDYI